MNLAQTTPVHPDCFCRRLLNCVGLLLVLRFAAEPALAQTPTVVSFTNAAAITKNPDIYGAASPFPSVITVPNFSGTLQKVTVTLSGVTADNASGFEIEVAGPSGPGVVVDLMYNGGDGSAANNLNLTFDDSASQPPPTSSALASGTYQPGGTDAGDFAFYEAPVQTTNKLAGFIGTALAGQWSLYVFDTGEYTSDPDTISQGWSLTFTYVASTPLLFNNPQLNNLGQFTASLSGSIGMPVVIEGSTDLLSWTPIATNAMTTSPVVFTDTNSLVHYLFYRAVLLSSLPVAIEFGTPQINGSGQFQATLSGPVGTPLVVQSSPDLQTWTPIATNAMATSPIIFTDTNALSPHLFYRGMTNSP
jgi:hypothetical protein